MKNKKMVYELDFFSCVGCGDFHENTGSEYCLGCDVLKVLKYSEVDDKRQCYICLKNFSTISSKERHLKTHNPVKNTPFKCTRKGCKSAFDTPSRLKRHQEIHSGIRYPCNICGALFKTRDNMKYHLKFSCITNIKSCGFVCAVEKCGQACGNYVNWSNHIKLNHGVNKSYYEQKK